MENQIVFSATGGSVISKTLYTGKVHITGGREGAAKSTDGRLDISLSTPGSTGKGTNPEQLFAAGWSACFIGAMQHNAAAAKIRLPEGTSVDAEVDLGTGDQGFALQARFQVHLPGLSIEEASGIVEAAHQSCPYSKISRNNINLEISVEV
ncbi:MAG: organic hydroperoxide resistance protein [Bacteroidota bacterium]